MEGEGSEQVARMPQPLLAHNYNDYGKENDEEGTKEGVSVHSMLGISKDHPSSNRTRKDDEDGWGGIGGPQRLPARGHASRSTARGRGKGRRGGKEELHYGSVQGSTSNILEEGIDKAAQGEKGEGEEDYADWRANQFLLARHHNLRGDNKANKHD